MLYEFENQLLEKFPTISQKTATEVVSDAEGTDEELMHLMTQGEQSALTVLYNRHLQLLRTVISRVVYNDQDVDDVVQDAFCELWRLASHYDPTKGKALGWIVTLARRRAIDRLRKKQAYYRAEERLRVEMDGKPEVMATGADEAAIADDTAQILQHALAALPQAQREAVHLAYYRGLTQREIAKHTATPLGTIKTRLELGVRKLKSAVLALGGAEAWMPSHA
jgi:RNA polymerase sigma-70 factor (ECF subfamily)